MARTTISEVIESIRRELSSVHRYEVSALAANLTAATTDTTITLSYDLPPSLRSGAVITIGTETMRVISVTSASKELVVLRGWEGSTAATHTAGDEVQINPRWTPHDVFEALQDEVTGLPESLYRVAHTQIGITDGADSVELPATWLGMYGLIDARWKIIDPINQINADRTSWPRVRGRIVRGDATWTEGPSTGIHFRFLRRATNYTGTTNVGYVFLTAALPFSTATFTAADDLVDDVGMQASMLDIVKMGVKLRLMPDAEIARSDRRGQDENRRSDEVPPGTALRALQGLYSQYLRRRQEETTRLKTQFPIRIA